MKYVLAYTTVFMFLPLFILFLSSTGKKFNKKGSRFSSNFILGFIIYTAIQAIGGILVQLLKLDWMVFVVYMCLEWIVLLAYKFDAKKFKLSTIWSALKKHMAEHYMLYIMAFLLLGMSLVNISALWSATSQDDGWYVTQIAQLPKMGDVYNINAPSGYTYLPSIARVINTFEMEAAFYSSMLHIPAMIYVKVYLVFFDYFLLLVCVYEFAQNIMKIKDKKQLCIRVCACVFFFALTKEMLRDNQLLFLVDDWQFNAAMGYGSSVVRISGIFIFLIPIMKRELFTMRTIVYGVLASIALVSKATQAVPLIYLLSAGLVVDWMLRRDKKLYVYGILVVVAGALCLLPTFGNDVARTLGNIKWVLTANFGKSSMSYVFIIALLVSYIGILLNKKWKKHFPKVLLVYVILSLGIGNVLFSAIIVCIYGFRLQNEYIRKWNTILVVGFLLMFVPKLNSLFVDLSVYYFVAGRTTTAFCVALILTAFVYIAYMLVEMKVDHKSVGIGFMAFGMSMIMFFCVSFQAEYSLLHSLKVLVKNPELVPTSTLELQAKLELLANDTGEDSVVVMPERYTVDDVTHFTYLLLRLHTTNVKGMSTVIRYGDVVPSEEASTFTRAEQKFVEDINNPKTDKEKAVNEFAKLLDKYKTINTVVVRESKSKDLLLQEHGFRLVDEVKFSDKGKSNVNYILYRNTK